MTAWTLLLLGLAAGDAEPPKDPLAGLRPDHPRLILRDDQLPTLRASIAAHDTAGRWHQALQKRAVALLGQPPTEFKIIGPRLLSASRNVLERVYTLSLIYRLDGNQEAGRRAVAELAAAAAWPHWNPSHFLDTAELNHAFGIGYDWLQPLLGEQREAIRTALLAKGLGPALEGYRKNAWWSNNHHNWNQVCNGGNAIGALAMAAEEPELAREIVGQAARLLPLAMRSYAPDGGWAEGPGYWHYATRYNVYALAAFETALGHDFGLAALPGFGQAGDFRLYFAGPTGLSFNYADAGPRVEPAEELFWLGRRFGKPVYYEQERRRAEPHALDLVWFSPEGDDPAGAGLPLDRLFDGVDVGFLRGDWRDPRATWVGFKGGDNRANHSHLDLGSFVLDALGQRWVHELGTDNYNLPGYFGKQRWSYYRLNTFGQNTLVVGNRNQEPAARAPVSSFVSRPERAHGVVDLTRAYPGVRRARRGFALLGRRDVLVVDEVEAAEPVSLEWRVHTAATVESSGSRAVLVQGGERLHATILEPAGATFAVESARCEPPQNPNQGISRIVVRWPEPVRQARLMVLFSPAADAEQPAVPPLDDWATKW